MKIAVMGYSGSGKSTLAKQLAAHYGIPLLYLDAVNFKENWQLRDREECRKIVADFMQNENWVIDGNYSAFYLPERLSQADIIIILRYNRFVCIRQAFRRNREYKGRSRESITQGCNEKLDLEFSFGLFLSSILRREKKSSGKYRQNIPIKHMCSDQEKN